MKAVHVSWAIILGAIAVVLTQISQVMQGHPPDWAAIGTAVMAIVGSFTPAAQLGLASFRSNPVQGGMPIAAVPNSTPPRPHE